MEKADASFTFIDRVEEIELNIDDGRWQSALALALTLPDICGGIAFPEVVKKYNLGIVIEDYGNIKENVIQYIENFVPNEFITNCRRLLTDVETDSGLLRNQLKNFFREESVKCLENMK